MAHRGTCDLRLSDDAIWCACMVQDKGLGMGRASSVGKSRRGISQKSVNLLVSAQFLRFLIAIFLALFHHHFTSLSCAWPDRLPQPVWLA